MTRRVTTIVCVIMHINHTQCTSWKPPCHFRQTHIYTRSQRTAGDIGSL